MSYTYKLPKTGQGGSGIPQEQTTEVNSVIIIGANGSGKSHLGAWIEEKQSDNTRRISAQRSLVFGEYIQQRSLQQSQNLLETGQENPQDGNRISRWGGQELIDGMWKPKYTTSLLQDYEYVLSALLAMWNNELREFAERCKHSEKSSQRYPRVPEMIIDKLSGIWNQVFPQRQICLDDAKVTAILNANQEKKYSGHRMSDGERVALYLIAQTLCLPKNKTIIIDEPEIHLHRSIMTRLWNAIENARPDCLFIYITHDTEFAATHKLSDKIWVKSFNGIDWDWEMVGESTLPESLLLELLGNRKKVLFVEGEANSYDTKLYQAIYSDYFVVPCGGCNQVILRTKAMKATNQLNHIEAYGLIDRDYRSEIELEKLKASGIYSLSVAEVENLFIVEEVLAVIAKNQGLNSMTVESVQNSIKERFRNQIDKQIATATVAELKYRLSAIDVNAVDNQDTLNDSLSQIKFDDIRNAKKEEFNAVLNSNNYKQYLTVFNEKSLCKCIDGLFGLKDKSYCDLVLRLISSTKLEELVKAIKPYLPPEIPLIQRDAIP